jgi:hypothetical protein
MLDVTHETLAPLAARHPELQRLHPVLVVGPHPDDEVIELGSRIPRLPGASSLCIEVGERARELEFDPRRVFRSLRGRSHLVVKSAA